MVSVNTTFGTSYKVMKSKWDLSSFGIIDLEISAIEFRYVTFGDINAFFCDRVNEFNFHVITLFFRHV